MGPARLLEAVPNFSEGRDLATVHAIVDAMRAAGAEVLDWSADADHHRSVVTLVGPPETVEDAALAGARVAVDRIDLTRHRGVHPRIGALDVLPFVPLLGLGLEDARASARRVGGRIADELGVPVFFYGDAADPPGRSLAELRRGGFEALRDGWPAGRRPDVLPPQWQRAGAHPTAGATCVGARPLLLAWNVYVAGVSDEVARDIAARVRETNGGFAGVRAMALRLPAAGRLQISMNIEKVDDASPLDVFRRIETLLAEHGGRIEETEIIGMVPDRLVRDAAAERLKLRAGDAGRVLSTRLLEIMTRQRANSRDG